MSIRMVVRLALLVAALLAALAVHAGAATLVGMWDFEGDPATTARLNKVPGVTWNISDVVTPSYISGGKLVCPVAYNASPSPPAVAGWFTGPVTAYLTTDIPDFRQKTTVLWLKLDKLGDSNDWIYLFRIESEMGTPGSTTNPAEATSWYSSKSQFDTIFRNSGGYHTDCYPFGITGTGPSVQPGQLIKLAEVVKDRNDGSYLTDVDYYWDLYDGLGLRKYGSTVSIDELYVSSYGNPANQDFIRFMSGVANLTGDTAGATFEEARIYDGTMTQSEIDALNYTGEPKLIGQWTFDSKGGTDPGANKAPGVNWSELSIAGTGATCADGKLVLPRYQSGGSWLQSKATTMLQTDLGTGKYSKELTQIAWVKWPGFDTTGDWARLTSMTKFTASAYSLPDARAVQSIAMKATDNTNWAGNRAWEYLDGASMATTSGWAINGGVDPPTNKVIKIAQVLRAVDAGNYEQATYWDLNDGNGLVQVGSVATIPAAKVNAFGQNGTNCLVSGAPSGNPRYDGFGIMDFCWNVPQSAGQIEFEEVRVYTGAMKTQDIADAASSPTPAPILVGQWTFDDYGGRGPLQSKASGASWKDLTVSGTGASISSGQLVLPRYQSAGVWSQSRATTMLASEMATHFREMTQVAWVKWPGFDTANDWARLTTVAKFPTSTFSTADAKASRGIVMKATDNSNWNSLGAYEWKNSGALTTTTLWSTLGGIDPPTNRFIKVAQVLRWKDSLSYEAVMYWDTGSGLVQIGSPQTVWNSMVNFFGQAGSQCLVDGAPAGNPRYDGFGIMDFCWNVPQSAGEIRFDEVRLYAGALSATDIGSLTAVVPTKKMMGQWIFDNYLGTGPLENKAPGVSWAPLTLTAGSGAAMADGKLVLPRYLSGTWKQSSATTMLNADVGPSGYAREVTHVL